jgi:protein-S-isoprenylcysteine O-methyltransferase Ste14
MAAIALGWVLPPRLPDGPLDVIGAILAFVGAVVVVWSYRALGDSMTPFPEPKAGGALRLGGPYRYVRHPMYAGGLVLFFGVSLARSWPALVATAVLAVLWDLKARHEERLLAARHPGYDDYRRRVRRRLVPWIY